MPKKLAKTVLVVVAGSRATNAEGEHQPRDLQVEILPGVTARDLLQKIGIADGVLKKPDEAYTFGANEELYPRVETGNKLHAVPRTPVAI